MDPSITKDYRTEVAKQIDRLAWRNERQLGLKTARSAVTNTVIQWEFEMYKQHLNNKQAYDDQVEAKRQMLQDNLSQIQNQQKVLHVMYTQIRTCIKECKERLDLIFITSTSSKRNQYRRTINGFVYRLKAVYGETLPNNGVKQRVYAIFLELKILKYKIDMRLHNFCLQLQVRADDLLNMDRTEALHRIASITRDKKTRLL